MFVRAAVLAVLVTVGPAGDSGAQERFSRFRLVTQDGGVVEGFRGRLEGQVFRGTTRAGDQFEIACDRLIQLEQYRGRRTGAGLALGILSGLSVGVVYMLLNDDTSDEAGTIPRTVAVFGGLAAAGGVVGAAIGGATTLWDPVPLGRGEIGGARELEGTAAVVFRF